MGGDIFYIIPINAYPVYINSCKKDKLTKIGRIYIPIQDVWGIWRKEVGVRKAEPIENIVLLAG